MHPISPSTNKMSMEIMILNFKVLSKSPEPLQKPPSFLWKQNILKKQSTSFDDVSHLIVQVKET